MNRRLGLFALCLSIFNTLIPLKSDAADLLYVVAQNSGKVGRYFTNGVADNANFITGLATPHSLAFDSSNNIYITGFTANYVKQYALNGTLLNGSFVSSGLANPMGIGFDSSGSMFVINNGNNLVSKYNSTGGLINASYLDTKNTGTNPSPDGLLIDASNNLYVVKWATSDVGKYTTAGTTGTAINNSYLLGSAITPSITWRPFQIAQDSLGNFYVTGNDRVVKYNSSGTILSSNLISVTGAYGITIDSQDRVYVGNSTGVGVYQTDGTAINASLITGLSNVTSLVIQKGVVVPEPSTYALATIASGVLAVLARRRK